MKTTPRPKDRIQDNTAEFRLAMANRQSYADAMPADYIRAVKIKRIRRYSLAERVLLVIVAALVAALIIHLFRA